MPDQPEPMPKTAHIDIMVKIAAHLRDYAVTHELNSIGKFAELMIAYMAAQRDVWATMEPGGQHYGIIQMLSGTVFMNDPTVGPALRALFEEGRDADRTP